MTYAGSVRRRDVLLMNFINKRIRNRKPLKGRKIQSRSRMVEEPLMETNSSIVMAHAPIAILKGVHPRVGMLLSFLKRSSCVGVERRIVIGTLLSPQASTMITRKTLSFTLHSPLH